MFVYFRGWDQLEATCNPNMREPKALWSVEEITDNRCKDHTVMYLLHRLCDKD